MAREMVKRSSGDLRVKLDGALKKSPGKKAAKKVPGKKSAKQTQKDSGQPKKIKDGGYHHLQRAAAVISLLEGESGGDLRMLLEEGVKRYRTGDASATGLLRAAEHLAMAGLYAARATHRLNVKAPAGDQVGKMLDKVGVRVDTLPESRLGSMGVELLRRAEGAEDDVHLAWELGMAADAVAEALEAE